MKRTSKPDDRLASLAANVTRLSRLLTRERDRLPAAYLKDAGLREAYRIYFLPPNAKKIHIPLSELALRPESFGTGNVLRVLDLGSGPGTSLIGVLEFFAARDRKPVLHFTAVDQVQENLAVAEELFARERNASRMTASLTTSRSTIQDSLRLTTGPFDLIILSNVLNELFAREGRHIEKRLVVLEDCLNRLLADHGACIIIEPALRETSRDLLLVRDGLIRLGFTIYAPCLCALPCPALENPRDWCHEDAPWDAPSALEELDALTGLRRDSLKFSYLTVRKDGRTLADALQETAFRVVSEPLVTKGKTEFFLCNERGRRLAMRLDKDATAANAAFGALMRGDVAVFNGLIDQGSRQRIGKETTVMRRLSRG